MSNLLTTTSTTRPSPANTGDMYFETDTGRLIIYGGSGWSQYSPAGAGESIDESINITYGTFDEILSITDKKPGDLFFRKNEPYVLKVKFTHPPQITYPPTNTATNSVYFFIHTMDDDEIMTSIQLYWRLTINSVGPDYYVDINEADWGTPNWSGSQNLVDNLTSRSLLPTGATAVISGDNNEIITFTSPTLMYVYNSGYFSEYDGAYQDFKNQEDSILIYTGLDQYDNEVYSQISKY
jgi:hypothetical protein